MKKKKLLLIIPIVIIIATAFYFFRYSLLAVKGVLEIETTPQTIVLLNGEQAGTTPFKKSFSPQNIKITLLSTDKDPTATPLWQGNVKINPSVLTFIKQDFSQGKEKSSGEILTLNKNPNKDFASLKISSLPNKATIIIDGQVKGYSPLMLEEIKPGRHILELSSPPYQSSILEININAGYRLDCEVKLASPTKNSAQEETPKNQNNAVSSNQEKVEILSTPTGWLRVREGPGTSFPQIGMVKPKEEYLLIEKKDNWFKIKLDKQKEGWISQSYAKKIVSPTP